MLESVVDIFNILLHPFLIHNQNVIVLTLLSSFPTCPSHVSCRAVATGNCLFGVSLNSPNILTLGISMTLGLTVTISNVIKDTTFCCQNVIN